MLLCVHVCAHKWRKVSLYSENQHNWNINNLFAAYSIHRRCWTILTKMTLRLVASGCLQSRVSERFLSIGAISLPAMICCCCYCCCRRLLLLLLFFMTENVCQICASVAPHCNDPVVMITVGRRALILSCLVAPGHLHSSLPVGPGTPSRKKVSTAGTYRPPKLLTK